MENLIPFVLVVLTAIVLIPSAAGHRPYFHVRNEEKDAESTSGRNPNLNSNPIYDFAMNLYLSTSKLKSEDENVLLSPFSIRGIMALIYMASRGNLLKQFTIRLDRIHVLKMCRENFRRDPSSIYVPRKPRWSCKRSSQTNFIPQGKSST